MCLSICRFRRVITHRHANHFAQTSYPSNTLILVPLLTLPRPSSHPRSNFHPRLHRPFFPPPPPLSTPVSADFSFPHLSTHCHFGYIIDRASLRILPLLSRAFLKITSQTYPFHFIFTYRSFHFQRVGNISILERRDFSRLDNFYKAR